ncbi:PIG-L family deacetylase [Yoonia sp. MH D7]
MPLSDQARIAAAQSRPRIVTLWRALTALKSTLSFMNTGAHPDDETSAMLAAMRFRDGIDISYACSTRGEGGQNDIGTETAAALGTLRTAEMEAACDMLDLRMYWHSTSIDDTITDFGFSKSGIETLGKWDRDRTLARFVEIIRTERPDIICPTFLDVSGQHGHHRAMTEAAHLVMGLAADPDFEGSALPVWLVKKMYLPAWSGAGLAYDDDLPPPPATITVCGTGKDPVTGWTYAQIGQQSRALHATQAMGRWVPAGSETDFPLHLAQTFVAGPDHELGSGLARTLRDLGFAEVQDLCDAAMDAFPDSAAVLKHASHALAALRDAIGSCDRAQIDAFGHKLSRKEQQLATVIGIAAGVSVRGALHTDVLHPDEQIAVTYDFGCDTGALTLTTDLPDGWVAQGDTITLGKDAATSDPYPAIYLPDQPAAPCLSATLICHGMTTTTRHPFEVSPVVIPTRAASLTPDANIINLAGANRSVTLQVSDVSPVGAQIGLTAPEGWNVAETDGHMTVTVPDTVAVGLYDLTLTLDRQPARSLRHIRHDHIAPRVLIRPAVTQVRVVDIALPAVTVGYIGGGNDHVGTWMTRMGFKVRDLSDVALTDAVLAGCDTIVIGIFAMKFCPGLTEAMPRIHDWARSGGTLVTLYHRPWDNWDADHTAPYHLEIGQPSLRWRVTDEAAQITVLAPDHPVLTTPNQITSADWDGWHKERGLYFAKAWDAAYTPLLAMSDPDEEPLLGAILVADVGRGRHVHTSLILHHQMEKLTSGGFRLMANILAKRS